MDLSTIKLSIAMASHLLLVCVVFGYAGGEENDKKREQRNFRQADFMPVGSLILS